MSLPVREDRDVSKSFKAAGESFEAPPLLFKNPYQISLEDAPPTDT